MTRKEEFFKALEVIKKALQDEIITTSYHNTVSRIMITSSGIHDMYYEGETDSFHFRYNQCSFEVQNDWVPLENKLIEAKKKFEDMNKQMLINNTEALKQKKYIDYLQSTIAELRGG